MLETQNWITRYFDEATDAVFIFANNQLVVCNQAASELREVLKVDPQYLLAVADAAVKQRFSQTDNCFSCVIKNHMREISIPLNLTPESSNSLRYFMVYHLIDKQEHVFSLTLKSRGVVKRMDQMAKQRQLTRYVNRAHEAERKRISQDLHDSIAQGVYSAIMGVRRLSEGTLSSDQTAQLASEIEHQLADTLSEVKGMALDIRPSVLDNFGLLAALRVLAKRLAENSGTAISVIGDADTSHLSTDVQSVLYRIGQESINNALKHAQAHEINVLLVAHDHYMLLEIIDDGIGFNVPKHQRFNGRSLGLMNMNERVKALNGTFEIKSEPGNGTTVTAKFPVEFS